MQIGAERPRQWGIAKVPQPWRSNKKRLQRKLQPLDVYWEFGAPGRI